MRSNRDVSGRTTGIRSLLATRACGIGAAETHADVGAAAPGRDPEGWRSIAIPNPSGRTLMGLREVPILKLYENGPFRHSACR